MKETQESKLIKIIIFVFLSTLVGYLVLGSVYRKEQRKKNMMSPTPIPTNIPTKTKTPPTLSPQEIEIIKKIETYEVFIEEGKVTPKTLEIKVHDQVRWFNKDNKIHQIVGEGWGNVPIAPGENFTRSFNQPGEYPYSDNNDPTIKGLIIVK
ncbi:MAG: hypothetical protein Q6367_001420 [Candidatus Freyarchaeota archaeon]